MKAVEELKIVMIIDDDKDDRFFFRLAIEEIDPAILYTEAKDGADALKVLTSATELPDFIFLDINMPRMNGVECLVELKTIERLKDIPVIMCSTTIYNKKECMDKGAAFFMNKPPDYTQLADTIVEAIEEG